LKNKTKLIALTTFLFVAFLSVSLTSCTMLPKNTSQPKRVLDKSTYASAEPGDFEGPYADEFARLVKNAGDGVNPDANPDYIYSIVKDSKITAQEFHETQELFTQCFQNHGMPVKYATDPTLLGSYIAINPGAAKDGYGGKVPNKDLEQIKNSCEAKIGYSDIATLYYKMQINPEKTDLVPLSAECLVKVGYKDPGYTAAEYKEEFEHFGIGTKGSFGNDTTEFGKGMNSTAPLGEASKKPTSEQLRDMELGITDKYAISDSDFNKCALNPKAVLNGVQ
jgi:hypothetical protein